MDAIKRNNSENPDREPDGRFKPGHSIKKPKGSRHMTTLLKEYIAKEVKGMKNDDGTPLEYGDGITKRVIKSALEGESWAVKLVYEYMDGKPAQSVDWTTGGDKINFVLNEDLTKRDGIS